MSVGDAGGDAGGDVLHTDIAKAKNEMTGANNEMTGAKNEYIVWTCTQQHTPTYAVIHTLTYKQPYTPTKTHIHHLLEHVAVLATQPHCTPPCLLYQAHQSLVHPTTQHHLHNIHSVSCVGLWCVVVFIHVTMLVVGRVLCVVCVCACVAPS